MIYDNMANCGQYAVINEKFDKAFAFIKKAVKENIPVGKYIIDGDELFASVQEYETKPLEERTFEGHKHYIDIQYIVSGVEIMESVDISKATVKKEYDPEIEAAFYENTDKALKIVAESDEYAIFFPHDIHRPGATFGDMPALVKKIVVKVRV